MCDCKHGRLLMCMAACIFSPRAGFFLSAAILSATLLLSGSIVEATGQAAPAANILLLNAYHPGYRWSGKIVDGIRETLLAQAPPTQLFVEHLDSKRIFRPAVFDRLADLIREKYRYLHFDAIIAADNNSLAYLKQHRQSLFDGIPVVFCGVNDLNPADLDGLAPVTGVNEAADVRETVDLALCLMPATRRVVVITDTTPTGRSVKSEIERVAATYTETVAFAFWDDLTMEVLLDRVAGLKSDDILLYTFFSATRRAGFSNTTIVRQYAETVDPVPCEKSKIQQVFLNILKNGAEAMTDYPAVTAVARFTLKIEDDGLWVRVDMADNGPGMEENTRRRVFEPFFTTKPAGKGTGLGLSVSYFIITENHSGKMDVFSTTGKGTRFVIRLPKSAGGVAHRC